MKKIAYNIFTITLGIGCFMYGSNVFGRFSLGNDSTIINTDINKVVNTQDIDNPIRDGIRWVVNGDGEGNSGIPGLVGTNIDISDQTTALNSTLKLIQNIVNYALGIVSLVALIYMIIHGIMILTAAGDDKKLSKGLKGIKKTIIALVGIGFSRLIISFILWIIKEFTN